MRVHVINHTRDGMVIHREGCADIGRAIKRGLTNSDWVLEVPEGKTPAQALADDLNEAGEPDAWSEADVRVMPCVGVAR